VELLHADACRLQARQLLWAGIDAAMQFRACSIDRSCMLQCTRYTIILFETMNHPSDQRDGKNVPGERVLMRGRPGSINAARRNV